MPLDDSDKTRRAKEQEKIQEVYRLIRDNGPITISEMASQGVESRQHLRTITRGIQQAGEIEETEDGWVACETPDVEYVP